MGILDVNVKGDESRVYQHQQGYFHQLTEALGVHSSQNPVVARCSSYSMKKLKQQCPGVIPECPLTAEAQVRLENVHIPLK